MNIILLSKTRKSPINVNLSRGTVAALALAVVVGFPALFVAVGYGIALTRFEPLPQTATASVASAEDRDEMARVVEEARYGINALARRVGELQAHAIRVDALGKRLVEAAKLDKDEFNFDEPPAVGGPEEVGMTSAMDVPDLLQALDRLEQQLESREQQLSVLEALTMNRILLEETVPGGWPIKKGWMSSHYGRRTDPFTGQRALHYGVDFAGKEGADVMTVGAGVVTWSGERYGYGLMVEVDHGNGYVTRYAHNKKNKVKVGDVVEKGQVIAAMGSSGRSTGPHVHFEVLRNGRAVDPAKYIRAAR